MSGYQKGYINSGILKLQVGTSVWVKHTRNMIFFLVLFQSETQNQAFS